MLMIRGGVFRQLLKARFSASPLHSVQDLQPSETVSNLADKLCALNLLETSQLVNILQKRLNLNPISSLSLSGPVQSSASSAAVNAESPKVVEKTEFKATLQKFDPASKAKIIREIKLILPQLNLVEAKSLVEGAPKVIKEKLKKEEAEKIKKTLEDIGATVTLD